MTALSNSEPMHAIIDDLLAKYRTNEPMLVKLISHVNQLPAIMAALEDTLHQRTERKKVLTLTSDEFIEQFLSDSDHNYFYNAAIDLFFSYNNVHYANIEEDDIIHTALTALQDYPDLKPWKYKIKNQIIKRIKDRELLNSIPESCTIQRVIGMVYPTLFTSRDAAKHFLTVMGDVLNRKPNSYYFISPKAKSFIKGMSLECCALFGIPNLSNVFKFKFYDHNYSECRLLNVNEIGVQTINIGEYASPFKRNLVDMMCVASHYSKRFGSADYFLESPYCKDPALATHCFYLKTSDEAAIVNKFITTTTEPCATCDITWKKMQYLWKLFLEDEKLPYIIFTNQLKTRLMTIIPNSQTATTSTSAVDGCEDENSHSDVIFTGLTSKHLPIVSEFLSFWSETIVINNNNNNINDGAYEEDELEVDELTVLFTNYMKTRKYSHKNIFGVNITDQFVGGLVKHFFSDVQIEDDKYIMNVSSTMWNKKDDIIQSLTGTGTVWRPGHYAGGSAGVAAGSTDANHNIVLDDNNTCSDHDQIQQQPQSPHMTIYNAYERYCACSYSRKSYVVSKRYFEKYYDLLIMASS